MAFKLGSSRGPALNKGQIEGRLSFKQTDASVPGTPVLRKNLKGGILGEANNDGSIFISNKGETYNRKNGKIFYNNEWVPEGSKDFPWEKMPWE